MQTNTHGYPYAELRLQTRIQRRHRFDDGQAGGHSARCCVFVGVRPAKVDHQPIPEVLGNMAVIGLDQLVGGGLLRPHHGPIVFGIKLSR
jgi:hypothetical protein